MSLLVFVCVCVIVPQSDDRLATALRHCDEVEFEAGAGALCSNAGHCSCSCLVRRLHTGI